MELVMYFVAMVGGSWDYEPEFLLKLLGVVFVVTVVMGWALETLGRRIDKRRLGSIKVRSE